MPKIHRRCHRDHPARRKARARFRRIFRSLSPVFLDGPAVGEILRITRAPGFLRVTQNGPCFRALDNPGDEPEETELIYVYENTGRITRDPVLANRTTYRFLPIQPKDNRIRLTHAWRAWATSQAEENSTDETEKRKRSR